MDHILVKILIDGVNVVLESRQPPAIGRGSQDLGGSLLLEFLKHLSTARFPDLNGAFLIYRDDAVVSGEGRGLLESLDPRNLPQLPGRLNVEHAHLCGAVDQRQSGVG